MTKHASGVEIATPALGGYDPVAYFEVGRPVQGNGFHTANYQGATYLFANKDHKAKFEANPEMYAPQYGGYCAYGVAVGKKFFSDPHRWKIVGGKLYLNLDENIQEKWNQDVPGYIAKADSNWTEIEHKNPADL
ncbi:YHS domain-containing (seleno)protein [Nitrospina gracilis]|uniref:YHS domain-containing (seleno)protein n=1 Tax=Nitrospina gracilis TaxID=35801 RepID=UPI001F3E5877|nr:YHS domain-containing (seleno)protein [Nitrospina gracilis]MCF8721784.1 YHS domain-containing protein [Nitrospina gracilis Nb-211]